MTISHTPGPWRVMRRANQLGTRSVLVVGRANQPIAEPKNFGDAALIAAAPELLAALRAIAAMTEEDPGTFRKRGGTYRGLVGEMARATIARAIGQA